MISYVENNKKFNFRVGVILINPINKKILIQKKINHPYWLLPGGRVEMLEESQKAVIREIDEELGLKISSCQIKVLAESFFKLKETTYHELGFYYQGELKDDKNLYQEEEEFIKREKEYIFKWERIDNLKKIDFRPQFLVDILLENDDKIYHIVEKNLED
ncbi:MAG: NUDIX hydrolase [Bacilli bacterium]|jgi:8-oxo-dGTP pyrophosphatase MutT (NUDIX family)